MIESFLRTHEGHRAVAQFAWRKNYIYKAVKPVKKMWIMWKTDIEISIIAARLESFLKCFI